MMNEMMWREIINNENKELFKEFMLDEADNFVLSINGDVQVKNYIEIKDIMNSCDVVYVGFDEEERFHLDVDNEHVTIEIL